LCRFYLLTDEVQMISNAQSATDKFVAAGTTMDLNQIMEVLPHRFPFLLVDRVVEIERERLVAIKNVTVNDAYCAGYLPDAPAMPNTLIVEAMAQAGGILLLLRHQDPKSKLLLFTGIEDAKFWRPVVPGDELRVVAAHLAWRRNAVRMQGTAFVGDERVAEAIVRCMLVDRAQVTAGSSEENQE
jgi:3-hydroxyacyl-[acyl-carrier-protein] dehydratase